MTENEFNAWFAYHSSQFPAVAKWDKEMAPVLDGWQEAMEDAKPHEARSASKAMLKGETDKAFGISDHPQVLMKWVRRHRAKVEANEQRHRKKCPTCNDNVWVQVYAPEAMQAAIWGKPIPFATRAARCGCVREEPDRRGRIALQYRTDIMVEYDPDHAALREWAADWVMAEQARRDETGGFAQGVPFDGKI